MQDDNTYMQRAWEEAKKAGARDEVPVGAVLVHVRTGEIVSACGNETKDRSDPTAHAEILCIRAVCAHERAQRIPDYDLFVTLEPCAMCAAAVSFARLRRIIFGASDPKMGGILHGGRFFTQTTCHHRPEIVSGLMAEESGLLLKTFFKARR